jgi:hypothetical protein
LTFTDTEEARRWLTDIIPEVATVEEVQAFKNLFKLVNKRCRGVLGTVSLVWSLLNNHVESGVLTTIRQQNHTVSTLFHSQHQQ